MVVFKYFVNGFVGCFLAGSRIMNKRFWGGFLWWFFNCVLMVTFGGLEKGLLVI